MNMFQIIPATPGWFVLDGYCGEGSPDRIEGFELVPVIAWHVQIDNAVTPQPEASPVVPGGMEPIGEPCEWILRSPEGQFLPRDGTRSGDADLAVSFLQEVFDRYRRRQQARLSAGDGA